MPDKAQAAKYPQIEDMSEQDSISLPYMSRLAQPDTIRKHKTNKDRTKDNRTNNPNG